MDINSTLFKVNCRPSLLKKGCKYNYSNIFNKMYLGNLVYCKKMRNVSYSTKI